MTDYFAIIAVLVGLLPLPFVLLYFRKLGKETEREINEKVSREYISKMRDLQTKYNLSDKEMDKHFDDFIIRVGIEDPDLAEAISDQLITEKEIEWFKNSKEISK